MLILGFEGKKPRVHKKAFVSEAAVIIGDVVIGAHSSVWPGAVIRADYGPIRIGEYTSVQDNCSIHVESEALSGRGRNECRIGDYVTIGHGAVVHGCTVEDNCMIGINATVFNEAVVKKGSIVGMNALVPAGKEFGPRAVIVGVPAKELKKIPRARELENIEHAKRYASLAERYMKMEKERRR